MNKSHVIFSLIKNPQYPIMPHRIHVSKNSIIKYFQVTTARMIIANQNVKLISQIIQQLIYKVVIHVNNNIRLFLLNRHNIYPSKLSSLNKLLFNCNLQLKKIQYRSMLMSSLMILVVNTHIINCTFRSQKTNCKKQLNHNFSLLLRTNSTFLNQLFKIIISYIYVFIDIHSYDEYYIVKTTNLYICTYHKYVCITIQFYFQQVLQNLLKDNQKLQKILANMTKKRYRQQEQDNVCRYIILFI
eukprot:TRINITY_DN10143_c0_g1_i14.p1 TRINITY_DN10143_c0_g1~~TRINITY_DN10143_c0_g1_i14.p1  ORF type:complete len:243 (+),score=-39.23 TRINITY_DN10143_c0_g1_i14:337-1065(+)